MKAIAQRWPRASTCLHILRALVSEQLVRVDPSTKQYSLGTGMLPLARAVLVNSDFASVVQPRLDDLSKRYGVTAIGVEVPTSTQGPELLFPIDIAAAEFDKFSEVILSRVDTTKTAIRRVR